MVGLRWNVTPEFMLRAEYHHVNGTGWFSRLDNPASEGPLSQHWDLYAIQASFASKQGFNEQKFRVINWKKFT